MDLLLWKIVELAQELVNSVPDKQEGRAAEIPLQPQGNIKEDPSCCHLDLHEEKALL